SIHALIGFTAWTLLLVILVFAWRGIEIVVNGKKADSWTRGKDVETPALVRRIEHAHMNCVENLPLFAVIVLAAAAMGKSAVTEPYAMFVLYARVAQSVTHLIGISHWLVMLRATFWAAQLALFVIMLAGLCGGSAA
ncbi:MAG: MAPEG family protein, partial [Nevskia sp.]|nr:MAPEG family protein [Nevskia sp.]